MHICHLLLTPNHVLMALFDVWQRTLLTSAACIPRRCTLSIIWDISRSTLHNSRSKRITTCISCTAMSSSSISSSTAELRGRCDHAQDGSTLSHVPPSRDTWVAADQQVCWTMKRHDHYHLDCQAAPFSTLPRPLPGRRHHQAARCLKYVHLILHRPCPLHGKLCRLYSTHPHLCFLEAFYVG